MFCATVEVRPLCVSVDAAANHSNIRLALLTVGDFE